MARKPTTIHTKKGSFQNSQVLYALEGRRKEPINSWGFPNAKWHKIDQNLSDLAARTVCQQVSHSNSRPRRESFIIKLDSTGVLIQQDLPGRVARWKCTHHVLQSAKHCVALPATSSPVKGPPLNTSISTHWHANYCMCEKHIYTYLDNFMYVVDMESIPLQQPIPVKNGSGWSRPCATIALSSCILYSIHVSTLIWN